MHPIVILIAGFLVVFVGGGTRFAIGLTLKPMVAELGWTRGELGLAIGSISWCRRLRPISLAASPIACPHGSC